MANSLKDISVTDLVEGVLASDRATIGRAITLVESRNTAHQVKAQEVLHTLLQFLLRNIN
ncbi:MAG: hypothetical protein JKY60_17825 [Kordiimonadaceae bacterium]|nr:hypothetical protein [Kordiimonadaceae bacterium]